MNLSLIRRIAFNAPRGRVVTVAEMHFKKMLQVFSFDQIAAIRQSDRGSGAAAQKVGRND